LPPEVIEAALLGYLHLFPVFDADGKILPRWFAVHNARPAAEMNVRAGLERVLAARLADASFFWETDRKTPLDEMARALNGVVFAEGAGTLADKVKRLKDWPQVLLELESSLRELGFNIGFHIGESEKLDLERAAALCKADLVSQMVREKEFTHLQGTMGRLYCREQGENDAVGAAVEEHYRPLGAADKLPATKLGRVLALADRLDTLVALFAAGHKPTGAKDPFGLRRAAVGVCRLLLEDDAGVFGGVALERFVAAAARAAAVPEDVERDVEDFVLGRLAQIFLDKGFRDDMVDAAVYPAPELELPLSHPADILRRLEALKAFHGDRAAYGRLAIAFKRPINILRQAREKGLPWGELDESRVAEHEERQLLAAYRELGPKVRGALGRADYKTALSYLSALRPAVDAFFDAVMVMTDDPALRANRLALMQLLADLFLSFADFTRLRGEEEYS
jgi:glycyl-tRNA synthetase beta chain